MNRGLIPTTMMMRMTNRAMVMMVVMMTIMKVVVLEHCCLIRGPRQQTKVTGVTRVTFVSPFMNHAIQARHVQNQRVSIGKDRTGI